MAQAQARLDLQRKLEEEEDARCPVLDIALSGTGLPASTDDAASAGGLVLAVYREPAVAAAKDADAPVPGPWRLIGTTQTSAAATPESSADAAPAADVTVFSKMLQLPFREGGLLQFKLFALDHSGEASLDSNELLGEVTATASHAASGDWLQVLQEDGTPIAGAKLRLDALLDGEPYRTEEQAEADRREADENAIPQELLKLLPKGATVSTGMHAHAHAHVHAHVQTHAQSARAHTHLHARTHTRTDLLASLEFEADGAAELLVYLQRFSAVRRTFETSEQLMPALQDTMGSGSALDLATRQHLVGVLSADVPSMLTSTNGPLRVTPGDLDKLVEKGGPEYEKHILSLHRLERKYWSLEDLAEALEQLCASGQLVNDEERSAVRAQLLAREVWVTPLNPSNEELDTLIVGGNGAKVGFLRR